MEGVQRFALDCFIFFTPKTFSIDIVFIALGFYLPLSDFQSVFQLLNKERGALRRALALRLSSALPW